jgi:hypothetical protein
VTSGFRFHSGLGEAPLPESVATMVNAAVCRPIKAAVFAAAKAGKLIQPSETIDQIALLGADVLLDEFGRAWLLEFTKGPALRYAQCCFPPGTGY